MDLLTFIMGWYVCGLIVLAYMLLHGSIVVVKNGQPVESFWEAFGFQLVVAGMITTTWPYAVFKVAQARRRG